MSHFLAIDVGTAPARAGLFDGRVELLASACASFELRSPLEHHTVYKMKDIRRAVGQAVRATVAPAPTWWHAGR